MARNFADATSEGHGPRLIRCWKHLMLHFKADGRTKYAVEAFNLISQVSATITPQMAYRLICNRMCNPKGGEGNIAMDLRNEHLNRTFKENINTFHAIISEKSVARSSQAIGQIEDMLKAIDGLLHVKTPSGRHVGPDLQKDLKTIFKVLTDEDVFECKDKRKHSAFPNYSSDPFAPIRYNPKAFQRWLLRRTKAAHIEYKLLTRVL